ncbi:uncharacterized protein LOC110821770 [Carica papaya]|uniref:uncharacterized protein LOC110821770 n=1 Tax=Carica papaya TaxID=3649 RepID=UPI000B8C8C47|nr:uncharacterized protein LOC110821770 [Carica papaya]
MSDGSQPVDEANQEPQQLEKRNQLTRGLEIYRNALDDIVNANGLFTIAVFVGLSLAQPGQRSLEERHECDADMTLGKQLVVSEVIAFACYLLSSLVAKALKIHLSVCTPEQYEQFKYKVIRGSLLVLSVWSSIFGCIFLTISMVHVIQIRVGKLSCGSVYTLRSAGTLIALVALALFIYITFTMHAVYVSMNGRT